MMSRCGPRCRISVAARRMLCMPESWRASSSLITSVSMRFSIAASALRLALDPEVHRVGDDEARRSDLLEHVELERGVDVAEQDERACRGRPPGASARRREHVELRVERRAVRRGPRRSGPAQRNVLPAARSTPSVSMPRARIAVERRLAGNRRRRRRRRAPARSSRRRTPSRWPSRRRRPSRCRWGARGRRRPSSRR